MKWNGFKLAKAEYEVVRQQIARLEPTHKRYQELESAENDLPQALEEKARLERVMLAKNKERTEAETRRNALQEQLGQYEEVKRLAAVADADLARLQSDLNGLKVAEGSYVKFIADCAKAAAEKKEREKARAKAEDERKLYTASDERIRAQGRAGAHYRKRHPGIAGGNQRSARPHHRQRHAGACSAPRKSLKPPKRKWKRSTSR